MIGSEYMTKDKTLIDDLNKIFSSNEDKRINVVATSCAGKSTLLYRVIYG